MKLGSNAQRMDRLTSWTDDEGTRFYSGTAMKSRSTCLQGLAGET